MYVLTQKTIETTDRNKMLELISEKWNYVVKILWKGYPDMKETFDDREGLFISCWEKLDLENLHNYATIYF